MADIFKQLGGIEVPSSNSPEPIKEPKEDIFKELGAEPVKAPEPVKPAIQGQDIFAELGAVEESIVQNLLKERDSGEVEDTEIERIGKRYNLSATEVAELKGVKEYFGSIKKDPEDLTDLDLKSIAKSTLGVFSRGALLNLPQFLYKKSQSNPNYRKALDDIQELGTERQSGFIKATEIGAGLAGAVGLGKGAAKVGGKFKKFYEPASAVAGGATQAAATSREDEELAEGAKGAALGGALFGGLYGAGKIAQGMYKGAKHLSGDFLEKSTKELEQNAPKIEEHIEAAVKAERPKVDAAKYILTEKPAALESFEDFSKEVNPNMIDDLVPESSLKKVLKDPEQLNAIAESLGKSRQQMTRGEIQTVLGYNTVQDIRTITEKFSGKSQSLDEIVKESKQFADTVIERAYKLSKVDNAVTDLKIRNKLSGFNPLQKAAIFISDGKFTAKIFDDKLGLKGDLSIERTLDEGSTALNRYTDMISNPLKQVYKLAKDARKSKADMGSVYDELDSGNITSDTAKEFKEFFDNLREQAIKADIFVEKRANYVPKLRKTFAEYRIAFSNQTKSIEDRLGKSLLDLNDAEYTKLINNDKQFKEINNELAQLAGDPVKTVDNFKYFLNTINKKPEEMKSGLETVASATKARTGEIPDWALEKHVPTLASRWIQGTFRHRALRDTIQKLKASATLAEKTGQPYIAKHLRNLTSDILGKRRGTLNAFGRDLADNLKVSMLKKAEQTDNKLLKKLYNGVGDIPSIVTQIQSQVYPNYLGYNPKSALQNLTSFYFQNMPEIGPVLGTKLAIESIADLAKAKSSGVNLTKMIEAEGILPRQWSGEMIEAVREGIKSSPIKDFGRKALDANANLAMALFTKSEIMARANTLFMAKRLGNHLARNPKQVGKILSNMSSSTYRKSVGDALRSGDIPKVQSELNKYMQSTNMFNYDRLNMSEYGRVMGPLFSIFSKWPTATAGKLAHYYISRSPKEATARTLKVLMMPMMAATLADQFILDDQSEISKKIIGSKGIAGWTQLDSLPTDVGVREGLLATPIAAAGMDFLDAVSDDKNKVKAIKRWVNNSFRSFFPGAGTIRFLAEDIPLYKTGKKSDKVNPLPE